MDTLTTEVQFDGKDYFINIPDEICEELDWQEGDTLDWQIEGEAIIIRNNTVKSRQESRKTNITEAEVKDWEDFWYNSESEGKDYFGFH